MVGNNCPDTVVAAFDAAGLDIDDDNMHTLNSMKLQRFAPILPAVLACEVCSASSGRACADSVALDVIETAFSRGLMAEDSDYMVRMIQQQQGDGSLEQIKAGE